MKTILIIIASLLSISAYANQTVEFEMVDDDTVILVHCVAHDCQAAVEKTYSIEEISELKVLQIAKSAGRTALIVGLGIVGYRGGAIVAAMAHFAADKRGRVALGGAIAAAAILATVGFLATKPISNWSKASIDVDNTLKIGERYELKSFKNSASQKKVDKYIDMMIAFLEKAEVTRI